MTGESLVRIDSKVESFSEDEDGVDVHFVSSAGEKGTVRGDVVIGADGIHSAIKAQLHPASKPKYTGWVIWRGALPAEKFTHEELPRDVTRTYGDSTRYYAYYYMPSEEGELVNWGAAVYVGEAEEPTERWSARGDKPDIMQHFKGWNGPIEKLIEDSTVIMKLYVHDRDPLPSWHSEGGRVTLLGDAAHAMLPFAGQGAGSSIEDGLRVAELLKDKTAGADVRKALLEYEGERLPYTSKLLTYCRDKGGIFEEFNAVQKAIDETGKSMSEIIEAGLDWNASKDANSFLRKLY